MMIIMVMVKMAVCFVSIWAVRHTVRLVLSTLSLSISQKCSSKVILMQKNITGTKFYYVVH